MSDKKPRSLTPRQCLAIHGGGLDEVGILTMARLKHARSSG